jgi:lipopolysaccharide/colanic/teichoic acid biosynthesis glycosyltransferase
MLTEEVRCINGVEPGQAVGVASEVPGPRLYLRTKGGIDFVVAAGLLVLAMPLILIAMVLVRLTSRGPALYSQRRLGRDGRPFTIYKIRSMYQDCERLSGPQWSSQDDPRVTPVGRYLRLTHLDELPQLLNVLRGEMSLVGPRPERPEFVTELDKAIPHYRERMLVRPGLTGLAQVQLPPDTDLESVRRKLACDLYYIQRVSFLLDLKILCSTASYLGGISFNVPRLLFRVPSGQPVEDAYRQLVETGAARVQST